MAQDPRALLQKVSWPLAQGPKEARPVLTSFVKADKLLASASGGFGFFNNKEDKYQNAADLYNQAANAYRMQKNSESFCPGPATRLLDQGGS